MQMIITSSNDKLIGLYACTVEARHHQAIQFNSREREHSRLDLIRTGLLGDLAPAPVAMGGDVPDELLVLLRGPEPPLHLLLVAAGVMPHARTHRPTSS
jgi:hypothetical protein